ncbi:hypothetical protein LG634_08890 [Streptomyces bambusae]|uniref:hypothetical protein n=1 Tax=Streptomyces bambusae TaxID=1550616 RepID=UPI001CFCFFDE|nr:hypothetical protein [Streptomyces bambusae]MCB5164943.1 hypothetical protein [Streptomyces bambusae]
MPRLPRRSTAWTRALGAGAVALAFAAPLLLWIRNGIQPRHDVVLLATGALVCAAGWVVAGTAAPRVAARAAAADGAVPGVPVLLPRSRRGWQVPALALALPLSLLTAGLLGSFPGPAAHARISTLQRAGAHVLPGTVVSAEQVTVSSWSYRRKGTKNVRDTPDEYRSDLVLTVPGPRGRSVRISAPGATTPLRPERGRSFPVLAAPARPELPGYVAAGTELRIHQPGYGVSPALAALMAAVLLFVLWLALLLTGVAAAPGRKEVRAVRASRPGERLALRTRLVELHGGDGLQFAATGADDAPVVLTVSRRRECAAALATELAGHTGWMVTVRPGTAALWIGDDGTFLWGLLHPTDAAFTPPPAAPARGLRRTTPLTWAHPAVHLGPLALAALALALLTPVLTDPGAKATVPMVLALLLGGGASALWAVLLRRRRRA